MRLDLNTLADTYLSPENGFTFELRTRFSSAGRILMVGASKGGLGAVAHGLVPIEQGHEGRLVQHLKSAVQADFDKFATPLPIR